MSEDNGSSNNQTSKQNTDNDSPKHASPPQTNEPTRKIEHGQIARVEYFTKATHSEESEK